MDPKTIQLLVESGKLTPEDVKLFTPQEKAVYDQVVASRTPSQGKIALINALSASLQNPMNAAGGIAALGAPLAVMASEGLPAALTAAIPYGKMAGHGMLAGGGAILASEALKKMGISSGTADAIPMLMMMMMGGKGGGAAAAEDASAAESSAASKIAGSKTPYRRVPVEDMRRFGGHFNADGSAKFGHETDLIDNALSGGFKTGEISPEDLNAVEQKVFGKGGQAAEARTFGVKPPPYPSNISTQPSDSDIMDLYTRGSASGQPSPLMFHTDDDQEIRQAIEALKKQVKRRSPQ